MTSNSIGFQVMSAGAIHIMFFVRTSITLLHLPGKRKSVSKHMRPGNQMMGGKREQQNMGSLRNFGQAWGRREGHRFDLGLNREVKPRVTLRPLPDKLGGRQGWAMTWRGF